MDKAERIARFNDTARLLHQCFEEKRHDPNYVELFAHYWIDLSPLPIDNSPFHVEHEKQRDIDFFALWAVRKGPSTVIAETGAPADVLRQPLGIAYYELEYTSLEQIVRSKIAIGFASLLKCAHRYDHISAEGANINGA